MRDAVHEREVAELADRDDFEGDVVDAGTHPDPLEERLLADRDAVAERAEEVVGQVRAEPVDVGLGDGADVVGVLLLEARHRPRRL